MAFEPHKIEIETPPVSMSGEQLPMLMRMGSSMVMGSRAAMTGNVAMLASSISLPILSHQYTKEEREEYEKKRTKNSAMELNSEEYRWDTLWRVEAAWRYR